MELLLVVAVVAILGSVAVVTVGNAREATRVSKLTSDVATINAAIQVYRISGGQPLPRNATPDDILRQLKKYASNATAPALSGLKRSVVDLRLKADPDPPSAGEPRAYWDGDKDDEAKRFFAIDSTHAGGVKNFLLDDAIAAGDLATEDRTATIKTQDSGWVWAYISPTPIPSSFGPSPSTGTALAGTDPTAPDTTPLLAPTFDPADPAQRLALFDPTLSFTIRNPNPIGTSQIYYRTSETGPYYQLYKGETLTAGLGETISARPKTSDPDHWSDDNIEAHITYRSIPIHLAVTVTPAVTALTYAEAGGEMTTGTTQTPPPATVTLQPDDTIPARYQDSGKFQVYYTYGDADPLTTGTAGPSFSNGFVSPSIDVGIGHWGIASRLAIKAAARSLDTSMFISSEAAVAYVDITPTLLSAPVIDPASGVKATDLPVSILNASGATYPVGTRIYYTLDGTDPGNNHGEPTGGTRYTGQFSSGAGTNGVVVVTARVYGPSGYGQWFTPSPPTANTYTSITLPEGALVGSAQLNGTFVGSLVYAQPTSGTMNSITFNSGAKIIGGNLYLPGTPTIRLTNGTQWSTANDSAFANYIQGWEYDSQGNKTAQTTPRVIDETGSVDPQNYTVSFNSNTLLEGKVIRRHDAPAFPTIPAPPNPDSNGSITYDSSPATPVSASQYASITLHSSVGDVRLNAGHYSNLGADGGTAAFVLGDPAHPDVTQVYSFQGLHLNNGSDIKVVGKSIVTVAGDVTLDSGSIIGNSAHPEWLQLQFSSGSLNAHPGSAIYAQLVAPTGNIKFDSGSVFVGSVTARSLDVSGNGVVFDLPPIIQN